MQPDSTVEKHAANSAFTAALALASGDDATAERFLDSMLRAHLLTRPLNAEVIFEGGGESGAW